MTNQYHRADPQEEIETLEKKSLRDEVFEFLHARIIAGKYAPGEWLRQEDISRQLGVSQTPVREALDQLVSAGLAERVPYRGVRVLKLTPEEIVDAYQLRLILESSAARLAALSIAEGQLAELYALLEQSRSLITLEEMSAQRQLNKRFHIALAAAAGNALLSRMYETVSNTFPDWMLYEYMFRHPELLQPSLQQEFEEHRLILEAIAAGDQALAAQRVVTHIRNLGEELEEFLGVPGELLRAKESQVEPWLAG
ncbi:MAG: GntR family transcriptional regulator [Anaerolineales bacterium]|nr:GntR family transcriptional regulator [Anaerolineales bacterium]